MKTRCAWCCAWTSGAVCEKCTAEVLPPHELGAARMLVDAGVDRLALRDRVRSLSRNQFVAMSSRFDVQLSVVQKRVEETRFIESFLVQRGFKELVEDALVARIPMPDDQLAQLGEGPKPPFEGDRDLEKIAEASPLEVNRRLASIALIHRRRIGKETFELALRAAHSYGWEPKIAAEAAIALTRWFVRWTPGIPWLGRWDAEAVREAVRPLLSSSELAPYAAVASGSENAELLGRALASADPDLRFAAALALSDEAELERALDDPDEQKSAAARSVLGRARSRLLHRRLAEETDDEKKKIIDSLRHPADAALIEALLEGAEKARPDVRQDALRFLTSSSFSNVPRESRAPIAAFLAREDIDPEEVMRALDWADEDAHLFAEAATALFERLDRSALAELFEEHRFKLRKWIVAAKNPREQRLLDDFLRDPRVAAIALAAAIDSEAFDVLLAWWDRDESRAGAHVFADAFSRNHSSAVRERVVPELWRRFKDREKDRAAILRALAAYRYDLKELRALEPRNSPFGTRDLVRFYETFAKNDPLEAPGLLDGALQESRDVKQLEALAELALPHAIELAATHPCTGARVAANLASHVVNKFRESPEVAELARAVEVLRRHHAQLIETLESARPADASEARFTHVIDQIETELRIAREVEERLREVKVREEERNAERRAREAEQRAAAAEERVRELERRVRELEAKLAAGSGGSGPVEPLPDHGTRWTIAPNIPSEGIDREPLLPNEPLPALYDFVAFMKEMSTGGDMMALLQRHGMDVASYQKCATAWSTLLGSRPTVAMRFAALMQAEWS